MKLVPDKDELEDKENKVVQYIDDRMIETPSIALANTVKETLRMGEKAKESLDLAMSSILDDEKENIQKSKEKEKEINRLQKTILDYLLKLSKAPLNEESREVVDALFNTVNDIERIGDHAENISELSEDAMNYEALFSKEGKKELKDMYNNVQYRRLAN